MKKFILAFLFLCPSLVRAQATNYCNNQIYQTFETNQAVGTQPTAITLAASANAMTGGTWSSSGGTVMTYSAVDMPALVAPGRLCGNNTTYTNSAGTRGIVFTGDGGLDFNLIQYNLATPVSKLVVSMMYNEDFGAGDGSKLDAMGIQNNGFGTVAFNAYGLPGAGGVRYVDLEVTGSGSFQQFTWNPSASCPCKITMTFNTGTATTGGAMSLLVQDKNGAQLGLINRTGPVGVYKATGVVFGDSQNGTPVTSGKHAYFDNEQISLDGSTPGMFCAGASPTWTSSPDNATLQSCINGISSADTINVLSGTATWSSAEVTNFSNKVPMNLIGQTLVSGAGTSSPSANDTTPGTSTTVYLNHTGGNGASLGLAVPVTGCPTPTSSKPCLRLSGFTFLMPVVGPAESISFFDANNTWPPPAGRLRVDNLHLSVSSGSPTGAMIATQDLYGVFDHNWFQNHSVQTIVHIVHFGDAVNKGFSGWNTPLAFGTDQAMYVENNSFQDDFCNTSGAGDGNQGARAVYRFNYELNGHIGFHGTDSGSELSMFSVEEYGNTFENDASGCNGLLNMVSRGGTYLWWGDKFIGTGTWGSGKLQQLRADPSVAIPSNNDWSAWGHSDGTQWYLNSATLGNSGMQFATTSGPDWSANQTYTCSQAAPCAIIPTSNNAGGYNYVSFTSGTGGSSRPTFNQTAGTTTADGTMNWINEWGATSTGVNAQRCPLNKDVFVTNVSQCPAGDQTGTLGFFDGPASAFGYPGANQIGRANQGAGTGETLNPDYQWSNSGVPNPGFFVQNDPTGNFIHECRDYYQKQGSPTFTGACSAGNGIGVGTLSARPSTCTAGVAYFATDQGNWNHTGNGLGQGQLYQCVSTNTWALYYAPLTAPHPLISGGNGPASPPSFAPGAGTYSTPQSVSITSSAFTVICYNTTGSPQTNGGAGCTVGALYSGPVTVSGPETLYAVAGGSGFSDSPVSSAVYAFIPGLSPATLSFGSVQIGTNSSPQPFVLSNYTGGTITYQGSTFLVGTNYFVNTATSTCTSSIPNASTCTISVIFAPTSVGNLSDTIQASFTGASGSPATASVSGTGISTTQGLPTAKALIAANLSACPVCSKLMQPCLCFTLDQNIYLSTGGAYSLFANLSPPVKSVNGKTGAVTLSVQ